MATSKEDILKAIEEMSVMDLVDLISDIEEKFGVTAAAAVAAAPVAAAGGDAEAAEEKDAFDVVLTAAGRSAAKSVSGGKNPIFQFRHVSVGSASAWCRPF
mgnify:CR=1 FL=1